MNLYDIYRQQGVNPVRDWQVTPPMERGFFNLLGASMRLYNPAFSVHKSLQNLIQLPTGEYDPFEDIPEEFQTPEFVGMFAKSNSKADTMRIASALRQELIDRQLLEGSGLKGVMTSLMAGATDPIQFMIPGSIVFKAAKSAGALRTAGRFMIGSTALAIPSEIALQAGVYTRTGVESMVDTIASGLFAGVIGAGVGAMTKGLAKSQTDELRDILELPDNKTLRLPLPKRFPEGKVTPEPIHAKQLRERLIFARASQEDTKRVITGLQDTINRFEGQPGKEALVVRLKNQLQNQVDYFKANQKLIDDLEVSIPQSGIVVPEKSREIMGLLEGYKRLPLFEKWLLPPPEGTIPGERGFTLLTDLEAALRRTVHPTIERSFPQGSITPEELVPRIEYEQFPLVPRQTYDPPIEQGLLNKARQVYEDWKGVMSFPGTLIDDADLKWMGRLLPYQDTTPPIHPSHRIYNALQESTVKEIRKLEKKIDSLVKQWQKKVEQALDNPTNTKLRNSAIKSARRIASEIAQQEDKISSLLNDVKHMDDLHNTLNMVEVERMGQRYFIPRDIIESNYVLHDVDGVHNPLDLDPDFSPPTKAEIEAAKPKRTIE